MKKRLFILILLFPVFLLGQTKIDENISVKFLGKPETTEFNIENTNPENVKAKATAFYLNSKDDSYIAMRINAIIDGKPYNELSQSIIALKAVYKHILTEQLKSMAKKGMFLKDSSQIKIDNYLAYKLSFKGKNSEEENAESRILILNGITYIFIYSQVASYDKVKKDQFFKSIKINHSENLKQIEEPYNYFNVIIRILGGVLFLYFIRKFLKKEKENNRIR
ncbi:hypothetical protein [Flavobacterium sp. FlaQc-50]|uniref:hypothetical protein n=1 Tax=unclassified Flavobacterium TaxID=196869 RepID=UPI003756B361